MYLEILTILIISLIITTLSVKQKIDETHIKEKYRKKTSNYSTRSQKWFLAFFFILLVSPLMFIYDINTGNLYLILCTILIALTRTFPTYMQQKIKAEFKDTDFQKNTTLTLYENFTGPITALFVFGIFLSQSSNSSILWYLITPLIGLFLLWSMRDKGFTLSKETRNLLLTHVGNGIIESAVIIFALKYGNEIISTTNKIFELENSIILILLMFAISYLPFFILFKKDLEIELKEKRGLKEIILNGLLHSVHDIVLFISFGILGPIILIVRRGFYIPIQNLYLNLSEGKNFKSLMKSLYQEPILNLKGGKDFIISFVDFIFNRLVKYIINLIT